MSPRSPSKKVVIIAGPNGAGKTTFAREFLPAEAALPVFINADLIAAGLSPFNPAAEADFSITQLSRGRDRRVATRVRQGGHDVAPDVIRRRFATGLRNFQQVYRHRVDDWQWFDNSGPIPRLLEEGSNR